MDAPTPAGPVARPGEPAPWCGQCGEDLTEADHARCVRAAPLEPPRYCAHCRRRMVVQVIPGTWTATCSRHGSVEQPTWG
ncbi:hypothetical protein KC207_13085 [Phycicoccus sp. BSK3Z-2]|uniref:Biotin synthase auxiliary protein n=1 Tax=Phycicoccus avicenniae TaxID=2828860 RepID=A0A941DDA8_9MICO|nr:hypothetical protein [Phycicoccus avicenniae]MBR7744222.1 hypothetical protein [Phycicoccus avicenniae]